MRIRLMKAVKRECVAYEAVPPQGKSFYESALLCHNNEDGHVSECKVRKITTVSYSVFAS
jgi:hypothetical protein